MYEKIKKDFAKERDTDGMTVQQRLLIFDDISFSGSLRDKDFGVISEMVCNCRKLSVSLIFTTQKYSHLSTTVRTNLNGAIFYNTSQKELELIEQDFNYGTSRKAFYNMFRYCTNDPHDFLVVNMTNPRDRWYSRGFNEVVELA